MDSHKIPPHNIEAEQSVLGGILIENSAIVQVLDIISASDFYKGGHKKLFECMLELSLGKEPIDIIPLTNLLKKKDILDEVGGISYIGHLVDSVPTTSNITNYAKIVKEKSVARQLIALAAGIQEKAYSGDEVEEILGHAQKDVMALSVKEQRNKLCSLKEAAHIVFKNLEQTYENPTHCAGLPMGLTQVDHMVHGLKPGDLVLVAGRPSMGKSSLGMQIADHVASLGRIVLVSSMEMTKEELALRQLSAKAKVNSIQIKKGSLSEDCWPRLTRAMGEIAEQKVVINDSGRQSELDIYNSALKVKAEHGGLDLIVIDYIGLCRASAHFKNRNEEVGYVSRSLKAMAKDLGVPVIALSQLNRGLEARTDKRPMLSDLRESGDLEQDADVVMFIYRDEVYNASPDNPNKGKAEIIIAKQRGGPVGTVDVAWEGKYTTFSDLPSVYEQPNRYGRD
mgnify:FL=1